MPEILILFRVRISLLIRCRSCTNLILGMCFYEHSLPNTQLVPPLVNKGTVKIHLEGSEASTPKAVAFGIYSEMVGKEEHIHRMEIPARLRCQSRVPMIFW